MLRLFGTVLASPGARGIIPTCGLPENVDECVGGSTAALGMLFSLATWYRTLTARPISNVGDTRGKIAILLEPSCFSCLWSLVEIYCKLE